VTYPEKKRDSYVYRGRDQDYSIEFINENWYFTYWVEDKNYYAVSLEDIITNPNNFGLGTTAAPFAVRGAPETEPEEVEAKPLFDDPPDDPDITVTEDPPDVKELTLKLEGATIEESRKTTLAEWNRIDNQVAEAMATIAMTTTASGSGTQVQQPFAPPRTPIQPQPPQPPQQPPAPPPAPPVGAGGGGPPGGGPPPGGGGGGPPPPPGGGPPAPGCHGNAISSRSASGH